MEHIFVFGCFFIVQFEKCLPSKWIVDRTNLWCITQCQTFILCIKCAAKIFQIPQSRTKLQIWMTAIHQNTENCLCRAGVINYLIIKKINNFCWIKCIEWLKKENGMSWIICVIGRTCFAKKIFSKRLSRTTEPAGSSSWTYLNKKISPWTGLKIMKKTISIEHSACKPVLTYDKSLNCSASRLHSSSTWTPSQPNIWIQKKIYENQTTNIHNLISFETQFNR